MCIAGGDVLWGSKVSWYIGLFSFVYYSGVSSLWW